MDSVLEGLPRDSRVAILRLRSLGDCVLTTPALDILRRSRPDLRTAVMVEDRFRGVFEGNSDVEEILAPELRGLRRWRPGLCLNLHGGSKSAWMTAMSGARYRAGFGHFRHQFVYNVRIPRAQEVLGVERKVHTAEHIASAMFYLGAERREIARAKLVVGQVPDLPGEEKLVGRSGTCPTCIFHAVAATPEKTWPADGFVHIAAHLLQSGLTPIFIGGPGDNLAAFQTYRTISGAPLSVIKSLLSTAALFIGNDSGPAHMAAAFGVPSVVLFGASDPAIWGPWRTPSEIVTSPGGLAAVQPAQVLEALQRLRVHV